MAGRKHSGPDGLSRRPSDSDTEDDNESVEGCIDNDLGINAVETFPHNSTPAPAPKQNTVVKLFVASLATPPTEQYDEHHLRVIQFLQTLQISTEIPRNKEKSFRIEATKYHIIARELFHRGKQGKPSMWVLCSKTRQNENSMTNLATAVETELLKRFSSAIGREIYIGTSNPM